MLYKNCASAESATASALSLHSPAFSILLWHNLAAVITLSGSGGATILFACNDFDTMFSTVADGVVNGVSYGGSFLTTRT